MLSNCVQKFHLYALKNLLTHILKTEYTLVFKGYIALEHLCSKLIYQMTSSVLDDYYFYSGVRYGLAFQSVLIIIIFSSCSTECCSNAISTIDGSSLFVPLSWTMNSALLYFTLSSIPPWAVERHSLGASPDLRNLASLDMSANSSSLGLFLGISYA
ncbi:uncharacterized protein LOC123441511 [Hordeum vulgare subsp. vulgare]|uniref:Predicted protein n=1 Tax=Hordeum vulgare subsp. vulgare TaxID=112509 RepID=F2CXJ7_HORVV|nr:uncharacterized protein LOC123441511 [Hordeum vulgare subsp. vulgare]BAJ87568.1 predicted protein [Hordeum vulgare subsp. vulgare]